jgi:hypothetical protein
MRLGQRKSRDKRFLLPGHQCSRATKSVRKRYSLLGSVRFLPHLQRGGRATRARNTPGPGEKKMQVSNIRLNRSSKPKKYSGSDEGSDRGPSCG